VLALLSIFNNNNNNNNIIIIIIIIIIITKFRSEVLKGRDNSEDLDVDGEIMFD
jgi:hypothetical protein